MSREDVALGEPPDDLDGFPGASAGDHDWFRAHAADHGPWWFASEGHGRFDLPDPFGTCYLASTVEVAVRERLGETLTRAGLISAVEADRMVVSRLRVDEEVADAANQDATAYGITRELGTIVPYELPQRWAVALHAAGFGGLRYWPRFSVGETLFAMGVFGSGGADDTRPADPRPIDGWDAAARAGVVVVGAPRALPTVEPPPSGYKDA